jgi:hypothetical protein
MAAVGLMFSAFTSQAGLGWSLAECQTHYKSEGSTTGKDDLGLDAYSFSTQGYSINVALENNKVITISYVTQSFDDGVIEKILATNAPKATWTKDDNGWFTDHSKPVYWTGTENGIGTYFAILTQITIFGTPVQKLQVSLQEVSDMINKQRKTSDL